MALDLLVQKEDALEEEISLSRQEEIHLILQKHFGKIEALPNSQVLVFDASNSDPIAKTGFFDERLCIPDYMSEYFERIWGMPPYNEWLYDPETLIDGFDAASKVGRYFDTVDVLTPLLSKLWKGYEGVNDEIDGEKLKKKGWKRYWSPERVGEYFMQGAKMKDFFAAVCLDEKGNLVGWLWGRTENPETLLDSKVTTNGEPLTEAFYIDTGGVSLMYRDKKLSHIKDEVLDANTRAINNITRTVYNGNSMTRTSKEDKKISRVLNGIGFHPTHSTSAYDDRVYWIKSDATKIEIVPNITNGDEASANAIESYEVTDNFLVRKVKGLEVMLVKFIDRMIQQENIEGGRRQVFEDLQLRISSGDFRIQLMKSYTDKKNLAETIAMLVVPLGLSGLTHTYLIANKNPLEIFIAAFELLPIPLGGLSSVYRAIYFLLTSGIPKYMDWNEDKGYSKGMALKSSLMTSIDLGWLLTPLVRGDENILLTEILIWTIVDQIKSLPVKVQTILTNRIKARINNNLES